MILFPILGSFTDPSKPVSKQKKKREARKAKKAEQEVF